MTSPEETLVCLKVGDKAPDFSASLFPKNEINLSSFHGKKNVILAFYPKDNTPGCTAEICAFSADLASFESADTAVFGVSCDSLESHEKFTAKHNLTVPLISDSAGAVGRLYGALREGRNSANRKLFIINKQGNVAHIHDGMPTMSELLTLVQELK
jgi:peroxiredoxin Q/BCP